VCAPLTLSPPRGCRCCEGCSYATGRLHPSLHFAVQLICAFDDRTKDFFVTVHRDEARTLSKDSYITGLAVMNNELYIGFWQRSEIEVYDVATLSPRRNLSIPRLGCAADLASCSQCDVVYISDECISKIFAINELGVVISVIDHYPETVPWLHALW
jgi:hypothetical protein